MTGNPFMLKGSHFGVIKMCALFTWQNIDLFFLPSFVDNNNKIVIFQIYIAPICKHRKRLIFKHSLKHSPKQHDSNSSTTPVFTFASGAFRCISPQFVSKFIHKPLNSRSWKPESFYDFTVSHVGQNGSSLIRPRSSNLTKKSASGRHFV